jgi:hypothetical protein
MRQITQSVVDLIEGSHCERGYLAAKVTVARR